jgi:hypothetical protein
MTPLSRCVRQPHPRIVFQWTHGRVGLTVERQQFLGLACVVTFNKSGAGR